MISILVLVSMTISIYLATDMIFQDKKSYLYDNLFQNTQNSKSILEFFYKTKQTTTSTYYDILTSQNEDSTNININTDPTLFKIKRFSQTQAKEILSFDISSDFNLVKNGFDKIYENKEIYKKYKYRETFLNIENDTYLAELGLKSIDGLAGRFIAPVNKAPRLVFCSSKRNLDIYCFEYLVDDIFEDFFSSTPYEIFLVGEKGNLVYHNKPYKFNNSLSWFLKNFKRILGIESNMSQKSGVREFEVEGDDLIASFSYLNLGSNYFLVSMVKQSDAFTVTKVLILKTSLVSLGILALLNILSLFFAESISGPINDLTEITQKISAGDFKIRIKDQSILELDFLRISFNKMIDQVVASRKKLEEYNKNLEFKVEERTKDLKSAKDFIGTVVDSLDQGLIVFDKSGKCEDLPSRACKDILGENTTNKKLVDVLKIKDIETTNSWIEALFEEMIPFESMKDLGPTELYFGGSYKEPNFKYVAIDYFSIRDESEMIKNVVAVASDKTKEFKSTKLLEEQTEVVKFISKLLIDPQEYKKFSIQFREEFLAAKSQFNMNDEDSVKDYLRLLHSFKGSCGLFSLTKISREIHDIETNHQESRDYSSVGDIIDRVIQMILDTDKIALEFTPQAQGEAFDINERMSFYHELKERSEEAAYLFRTKYLMISYQKMFRKYSSLIEDLSRKLGKKVRPLIFEGEDYQIDFVTFNSFVDSCIHIFRNAIDHGIEDPELRLIEGKDVFATVKMRISKGDGEILIHIKDDGRGIRADKIRSKMKELNYDQTLIQKTDDQIIYHIFDPEFSTADEVSEISGRGVGLYDVKKFVENMKGEIILLTHPGLGTEFIFKFPEKSFL